MKTQKKLSKNHHLPIRNNRWKWMAGATAATAATATGAHAQIVQINLINNQVNTLTGVNLNADLTGTGPSLASVKGGVQGHGANLYASFRDGTVPVSIAVVAGFQNNQFYAVLVKEGANPAYSGIVSAKGSTAQKAYALMPITLTSANVNGGLTTNALLEFEAFNTSTTDSTDALTRLVYDNGNASISTATLLSDTTPGGSNTVIGSTLNGNYTPTDVPEPSTLGLLALGAGGLLARRRMLQKAA